MSGQNCVRKMSCQVDVMSGKCVQDLNWNPSLTSFIWPGSIWTLFRIPLLLNLKQVLKQSNNLSQRNATLYFVSIFADSCPCTLQITDSICKRGLPFSQFARTVRYLFNMYLGTTSYFNIVYLLSTFIFKQIRLCLIFKPFSLALAGSMLLLELKLQPLYQVVPDPRVPPAFSLELYSLPLRS